ncbi:sodium/glutamate symporter [Qipengyuania flava]|uniref:sodium/glutamate symporter n=1 Tax=Qipengyuania flava TaxID=192812 RepID=UPI001C62FBE8|nr:sodium/glutamate symporter [Qipengyuania flava]QYJ08334.1 sodium/glutamate symporter [Qipengyuania flava]
MEFLDANTLQLDNFVTLTLGIIVLFVGIKVTERIGFLQKYNIPEPVTGGIVASLLGLFAYLAFDFEVEFSLYARDVFLVYFFTTIGINARFAQLLAGGKPLLIFLGLTLAYLALQDGVGYAAAAAMGQPSGVGVLVGSASLAGGHGTAIAWAPTISQQQGVANALEIGVAAATIGLVIASLLGGPIAKVLLSRYNLKPESDGDLLVGIQREKQDETAITHLNLMGAILVIHIAMILGYVLNLAIGEMGLRLPLFVSCMMVAILLTNTIPLMFKTVTWPTGSKALALISDLSLGLFIAMSLMGMQLWEVAGLAGPLFGILAAQVVVAVLFILFVVFPLMGKNYFAAVLSAGFAGFCLGATPTAIANMSAVTKTHGPAPTAFIIVPLVGAFFVDVANAFLIQFFLSL